MNLALVAAGGAIGSVARYLFSTAVLQATGSLLGVGTFAVNAVGCTVFGLIAGLAERRFVFGPELKVRTTRETFFHRLCELITS